MIAALAVEWLKLRRSLAARVATLMLSVVPAVMALAFVRVAARGGSDALAAKASALIRGHGWAAYADALVQIFASAGLLGMGIVVIWCFAREFAEGTVVSLYATVVSRVQVAAAKLLVLTAWCLAVAVLVGLVAILIGVAGGLGLPAGSDVVVLGRVVVLAALTGLLALTAAVVACLGRGYLAGVAGLLGMVTAAQIAAVFGAGAWFPWSVPGYWAVGSAGGAPAVPESRLMVVPLTTALAALWTLGWWRRCRLA